MASKFASGKHAIAECDICGQRYKLKELRKLTIKTKQVSIKACPECWNPDQPQLSLGMYPIDDPQALREPRPDTSYLASGNSGLQVILTNSDAVNAVGVPQGGSRVIQWGYNPVGGARSFDSVLTPNYLIGAGQLGTVTISTT
jgi:hypothetical protein